MNKISLFCLPLMLSLMSCSLFSPAEITPPNKFVLDEHPFGLAKNKTHAGTLFIQTPTTRPIFNTTQMAYSTQTHQIAFFSYNEWAETPAQMLQSLLVRTLQTTNAFNAVVTEQFMGSADYVLTTQIQELIQDLTQCPAVIRITVHASLVQSSSNLVVAQKEFTVEEPISDETPYCGVIAANHAMVKVLQHIARFVIDKRQIKTTFDAACHPYKQNDETKPH
jgi:cholesterol transport system auxiliary component